MSLCLGSVMDLIRWVVRKLFCVMMFGVSVSLVMWCVMILRLVMCCVFLVNSWKKLVLFMVW